MKKKTFIVVLLVLVLFTLNFTVAHEIDNSTTEDLQNPLDDEVLTASSDANDTALQATAAVKTQLDVEGKTDFDVIGDNFKVKLSDVNGKVVSNAKLTFTVSGTSYTKTTDSNGIASLQLRLNDGTYKITTRFAGNSNYKSSSLTTTVTMSNTRVVGDALSSSEIQKIIDNAKVNNVILFKGKSYSDINLVITKSLTLISKVDTVLKASSGNVITIKGKGASLTTIKGFKIQSGSNGIVVSDSDYVTIVGNDMALNGNGIVASGTKYLNITKNNIVKNSKSGIVLRDATSTYIFNNNIKNNGEDGIGIAKSDKVYIHDNDINGNSGNGVHLSTTVNGNDYGEGPKNVHISKNSIESNGKNGILISSAENNININSNNIELNKANGIAIGHIGNNKIQSNVIYDNSGNGIRFIKGYDEPRFQDISYNAIFKNHGVEIEAKETSFSDTVQLSIGENWYSDHNTLCPKISTKNIKFVVKQTGENQFQASFFDSNGNIASLLPDRTLTYQTNDGQSVTLTISGGVATFTTDANIGDLVKATVDYSERDNTYDGSVSSNSKPVNGKSPTYSYPNIPNYQIYEDIGSGNGGGNGNGDGTGEGLGGDANKGNGKATRESSSNTGNSTYSQKTDPANNAANQVNDVSQSYDTDVSTSQASASEASTGDTGTPGSQSQSVVKQIIFDEDEFFRVTGISFIVLLMVLTVGFYYRDDIKEMNSKR